MRVGDRDVTAKIEGLTLTQLGVSADASVPNNVHCIQELSN